MDPRARPRRWVLIGAAVAVLAAGWLLLVPRTAVYVAATDAPEPRLVATHLSWWTPEQNLAYSDAGLGATAHVVNGVRLDCGNAFSTGPSEAGLAPPGPKACAAMEAPRTAIALVLITSALVGGLGAPFVPAETARFTERYRLPRAQRRALRKG